jgi:uncharacterized protein (DUF2252 family)
MSSEGRGREAPNSSDPSSDARLTRAQRYAAGKALRQRASRSSHASWAPARDRPDPVELLRSTDGERVPRLLPIRYGRMSLSPFTFFRGAAPLMAHDLATTPVTGLRSQLCGDAHLSNFGIFGTPERNEVFDINDFDETLPGPWEWDVKRLATSFVLAGRQNGLRRSDTHRAARAAARSYRTMMAQFASMRYQDVWYYHLGTNGAAPRARGRPRRLLDLAVAKARRRTGFHVFPKLARVVNGRGRIRNVPPLIVHYRNRAAEELSRSFFERYRDSLPDERRMLLDRYEVADVAQKVVGIGSVGLGCSILLLLGDRDLEDPLFLQVKQATASALEPYLGASPYPNHAQRVVTGQHLIQEASDIFLGWSRHRSQDFYVRQLRDMKFVYDVLSLGPRQLEGQAELCGTALARAHARTGDPSRISGYLGSRDVFDEAVARFAEAYADQSEKDHGELLVAIKKGRVAAESDV